jgi:hypothetical protein
VNYCEQCFLQWHDLDLSDAPGIPGPNNSFLLLRPDCPDCGCQLRCIGIREAYPVPSSQNIHYLS